MNTTTIHRRIASGIVTAIAFSAFAACGTEVEPPAQDIGDKVQKQDRTAPAPDHKSGNRYDFGDEYGTPKIREHKARPAGSGTRNRMDFRDAGQ